MITLRSDCVTERNVLAARSCAALPCVLGLRKTNYEETSLLLRYGGSSFTLLHSHGRGGGHLPL